jgi:hypothetical protein
MIQEELSGKIVGAGMNVLNELGPGLDDPAAAGLRTRKCLGTEEDNLPTKHTKHPKEEKPLPLLVCFRVFGGQRSLLLQRLLDPESQSGGLFHRHAHSSNARVSQYYRVGSGPAA